MKKLALILILTLSSAGLFVTKQSVRVEAQQIGSNFQASRIIDDSIFFKGNEMSVEQIQQFLNARVPVCDTNGQKLHWSGQTRAQWAAANNRPSPPYICLKDFVAESTPAKSDSGLCSPIPAQNNRSAAQIINDVARACNISQKVLLVTLEKEQSLVSDDWPWPVQYEKAMGYYCPDDPTRPGWCHPDYAGFFNQVYNAARQFQRYRQQPNQFNHAINRTSYVAYQANAPSCGGTNLRLQTAATAGLYNYTPYQPNQAALNNLYGLGDSCSAYGNRNFWRMYRDWFGSTEFLAYDCDSRVTGINCVWSFTKTDGSQFLTSSRSELDFIVTNYNWIYEGIAFYAAQTQRPGTVPVYRLRLNNQHFYTTDQNEYTSRKNSSWIDEGIAFYVYPNTTSTNMSHRVHRLYNSTLNQRYWTIDESRRISLLNSGYVQESSSFNSLTGLVDLSAPPSGRNNVYRLSNNLGHFYTTNIRELEAVIRVGFIYEGILTTASTTASGTPIYRLQHKNGYFYTASINERNTAIQNFGMTDEGIGFRLDENSNQVYRLTNTERVRYLYTSSFEEAISLSNRNGWMYENTLFSKPSTPSPVYRFLNLFNSRHFYTIDINEAMRITNKGWKYETIAFNANMSVGQPVYRLLLNDKHFYTTDINERDRAVSAFGYTYEGVVFYVSQTQSSKPVYRLQGGNDEYLYTASLAERDRAVSRFGYYFEGTVFYLP